MAEDNITEVHLFSPDFEEFFIRYAQQIGHGQVFIETEDTLPADSPVELVFQIIYEDLELIRAKGSVSYVVDKDGKSNTPPPGSAAISHSLPGMVVKIEDMDETFKVYVMELIKRQIRSDLSKMFTT